MRVTISLALLGMLLSCLPTKGQDQGTLVFTATPAPVGPRNPRNSEAAIIQRKDGSLLLGWTEFYAGSGADHGPARISGKISTDTGRTWGDKYTLVGNDGGCNVMEVNFLRLTGGEGGIFRAENLNVLGHRVVSRLVPRRNAFDLRWRAMTRDGRAPDFAAIVVRRHDVDVGDTACGENHVLQNRHQRPGDVLALDHDHVVFAYAAEGVVQEIVCPGFQLRFGDAHTRFHGVTDQKDRKKVRKGEEKTGESRAHCEKRRKCVLCLYNAIQSGLSSECTASRRGSRKRRTS